MTHQDRGAVLDAATTHARQLAADLGRPPRMIDYDASRPDGVPASSTLRIIYGIAWREIVARCEAPPPTDPAVLRAAIESDPTVCAVVAAIVEIRRSLGGAQVRLRDYNRHRPRHLPQVATLTARCGVAWSHLLDMAARHAAESTPPQPLPAGEIVTAPPLVTGNVSSDEPAISPAAPPAAPLQRTPRGRALADIQSDPAYIGLPEPEIDAVTGRLRPPRDCEGFPVWRVKVAPGERTCAECGDTFHPGALWYEDHGLGRGGCCQRCAGRADDYAVSQRPSVLTAAYLQPEEAQP